MNSIPALSKALLSASSVFAWVFGTPSSVSSLIIVEHPTPDFTESSLPVHLRKDRHPRIWSLVNK
jgi:hypothetical protein